MSFSISASRIAFAACAGGARQDSAASETARSEPRHERGQRRAPASPHPNPPPPPAGEEIKGTGKVILGATVFLPPPLAGEGGVGAASEGAAAPAGARWRGNENA